MALLKDGCEIIFLVRKGMYENTESVRKMMQTDAD
jgi:hypothetical protein